MKVGPIKKNDMPVFNWKVCGNNTKIMFKEELLQYLQILGSTTQCVVQINIMNRG